MECEVFILIFVCKREGHFTFENQVKLRKHFSLPHDLLVSNEDAAVHAGYKATDELIAALQVDAAVLIAE